MSIKNISHQLYDAKNRFNEMFDADPNLKHYNKHMHSLINGESGELSEIATELSWRDWKIEQLNQQLNKSKEDIVRLEKYINQLPYQEIMLIINEMFDKRQYDPKPISDSKLNKEEIAKLFGLIFYNKVLEIGIERLTESENYEDYANLVDFFIETLMLNFGSKSFKIALEKFKENAKEESSNDKSDIPTEAKTIIIKSLKEILIKYPNLINESDFNDDDDDKEIINSTDDKIDVYIVKMIDLITNSSDDIGDDIECPIENATSIIDKMFDKRQYDPKLISDSKLNKEEIAKLFGFIFYNKVLEIGIERLTESEDYANLVDFFLETLLLNFDSKSFKIALEKFKENTKEENIPTEAKTIIVQSLKEILKKNPNLINDDFNDDDKIEAYLWKIIDLITNTSCDIYDYIE